MIKIFVAYFGIPESLWSNLQFQYLIKAIDEYQNIEIIAIVDASIKLSFKAQIQKIRDILRAKGLFTPLFLLDKLYNRYNRYKRKQEFRVENLIKVAKRKKIPIITPENYDVNNKDFLAKLKKLNPDLLLLCGCSQIIKNDFLNSFPDKIISFHPALLPKYAGFGAFVRPLISNEQEAGITFHYITKEIDGGDIVLQKKIRLEKDDNTYSLELKLLKIACQSMRELVLKISTGNLQGRPQDLSKRCYYRARDLENLMLGMKKKSIL